MNAIEVRGLSKEYRLGQSGMGSLKDDIESFIARVRGRPDPNSILIEGMRKKFAGRIVGNRIKALDDVTFDVPQGDLVGIIGKNGAGKSTLLKLLSRVTAPSAGTARIRGRLASLLEVGTGFHPELTGRENIFLNASIYGLKRQDVLAKLESIVDFSGIEEFLDTPVKRYSSGMYVRLAFAVAAHLDPDILVVDEVLAVGDLQFQKRCMAKMGEVGKSGRTVLIVSHNLSSIANLTKRSLLIEDGQLRFDGETSQALARYVASIDIRPGERVWTEADAPKSALLQLNYVRTCTADGKVKATFQIDEEIRVVLGVRCLQAVPDLKVGVVFRDELGSYLFVLINHPDETPVSDDFHGTGYPPGDYELTCVIPAFLLNKITFSLDVTVRPRIGVVDLRLNDVVSFSVTDGPDTNKTGIEMAGFIRPRLPWTTRKVSG